MSSRYRWLFLLLIGGACSGDPLTQIVVVVDSDSAGFSEIDIAIEGFERDRNVDIEDLERVPLPRKLTLVHDGGKLGPLAVTVRAYVEGHDEPVLRERRTRVFFERGKSRMLKIDLLLACIELRCAEACIEGRCVDGDDASALVAWDDDFDSLRVSHTITFDEDSGVIDTTPEAGMPPEAGSVAAAGSGGEPPKAGSMAPPDDATVEDSDVPVEPDTGPPTSVPAFMYEPSNFDPNTISLFQDERPNVKLDCGLVAFDSTTLEFTADSACGELPLVNIIEQSDGTEAAVLAMDTLIVESGTTVLLTGERAVIFAVYGGANIAGTIDASAHQEVPGPGAVIDCGSAGGSSGANGTASAAGSGGSGAGHGSSGGRGGQGAGATALRVDGGVIDGEDTISPLRGGCAGGRGGAGDAEGGLGGAGGGAVQISAAGALQLSGRMLASGGGGLPGTDSGDGGGGGGSGGAILLEGETVVIDSASVIAVNGGGGGGGQPSSLVSPTSEPGADGLAEVAVATGGVGSSSGGDGGDGACSLAEASDGQDGNVVLQDSLGGAGGGGGGVGRIRINRAGNCLLRGIFSPSPSVSCTLCGTACPPPLAIGCASVAYDGQQYMLCATPVSWTDARERCQDAGTDLIHVDDADENDWLSSQVSGWVWLGASDAAQEGDWRWVADDTRFWSGSSDGSSVGDAYEAWAATEPSSSGDCARLEDGSWSAHSCSLTGGFACE